MLIKDIIILEQRFKSTKELIDYLFEKAQKNGKIFDGKIHNLFLHFTNIPKVGLYPMSDFDTPLGFYSYPFDYVYDNYLKYLEKKDSKEENLNKTSEMEFLVPFAGDRKYIIAFSINRQGVKLLQDFTEGEFKIYLEKIVDFHYLKNLENKYGKTYSKDEIIKDSLIKAKKDSQGNIGKKFWYFVYNVCEEISIIEQKRISLITRELFLFLNFKGFVDLGDGIIHTNRPYQAVFFNINRIKDYRILYNKRSKIEDTEKEYYNLISRFKKIVYDFFINLSKNKKERHEFIDIISNSLEYNYKSQNLLENTKRIIYEKYRYYFKKKHQNDFKKFLDKYITEDIFTITSLYFEKDKFPKFDIIPDIIGKGDEDNEVLLRFFNSLLSSAAKNRTSKILLDKFLDTPSFKTISKYLKNNKEYIHTLKDALYSHIKEFIKDSYDFFGKFDYYDFIYVFIKNRIKKNLFDDLVSFFASTYFKYKRAFINIGEFILDENEILKIVKEIFEEILLKEDLILRIFNRLHEKNYIYLNDIKDIYKAFEKNKEDSRVLKIYVKVVEFLESIEKEIRVKDSERNT